MTTLHPTPEERYEEAIRKAEHDWLSEANYDAHREYFVRQELINAIREAEAAAEARGRAMERKEITVRARRLRKRFGKCEGSFREEIIWGHGLRIEKMIRARTDKENSDG